MFPTYQTVRSFRRDRRGATCTGSEFDSVFFFFLDLDVLVNVEMSSLLCFVPDTGATTSNDFSLITFPAESLICSKFPVSPILSIAYVG